MGEFEYFLFGCKLCIWVTSRAIYNGEALVGFASHGWNKESGRYEMVSIMIGYPYQGRGYGAAVLQLVIDKMVQMHQCQEICLSVIHDNERTIRVYEKRGFKPTGEIEPGHHPEPIYCLKVEYFFLLVIIGSK